MIPDLSYQVWGSHGGTGSSLPEVWEEMREEWLQDRAAAAAAAASAAAAAVATEACDDQAGDELLNYDWDPTQPGWSRGMREGMLGTEWVPERND